MLYIILYSIERLHYHDTHYVAMNKSVRNFKCIQLTNFQRDINYQFIVLFNQCIVKNATIFILLHFERMYKMVTVFNIIIFNIKTR
jgi:hypothetical protein